MARNTTPRTPKPWGTPRLPGNGTPQSNGQTPQGGPVDEGTHEAQDTQEAQQTIAYVGFSGTSKSSLMGYWVPCPLPVYNGMRVLFRTNNAVGLRHTRPSHYMPYDLRRLVREEEKLGSSLRESFTEEGDQALEKIRLDILAARAAYEDRYAREQCEWLSSYIIDIEPWAFTDIEKPDPSEPKSYHVLYTHLSDLYLWALADGYDAALEMSVKNL